MGTLAKTPRDPQIAQNSNWGVLAYVIDPEDNILGEYHVPFLLHFFGQIGFSCCLKFVNGHTISK